MTSLYIVLNPLIQFDHGDERAGGGISGSKLNEFIRVESKIKAIERERSEKPNWIDTDPCEDLSAT